MSQGEGGGHGASDPPGDTQAFPFGKPFCLKKKIDQYAEQSVYRLGPNKNIEAHCVKDTKDDLELAPSDALSGASAEPLLGALCGPGSVVRLLRAATM